MAKGRMLNRETSLSLKLNALVNDTTRLLATWTIPHLDKHGVFHADAQIVKSLVFVRGKEPVVVLCAGDRRVDADRLGIQPASPDVVREATGFAIGGVPPFGHASANETLIDSSLRRFDVVWAAAGHPRAVFEIATDDLIAALPDATVTEV